LPEDSDRPKQPCRFDRGDLNSSLRRETKR
jgi:hypothetical protein